jgi:hypothetical protein
MGRKVISASFVPVRALGFIPGKKNVRWIRILWASAIGQAPREKSVVAVSLVAMMRPDTAFDTHQSVVNAAPESVCEARRRRNFFCDAFGKQLDVTETIPSGSLARGTQRDPIHDVDLIIVFRQEDHPDWDTGNGSAEDALEYLRGQVTDLLGVTAGTFAQEVRRAHLRNHVVKCFLDDPDDPDAFAVEVMPALRRAEGGLRIPERNNDMGWVTADPEFLLSEVAARHSEWRFFAPWSGVLRSGRTSQTWP